MMPTDTTKPNLLLVEDSEDDAYFFKRMLQKSKMDCVVHHARDGAEAVAYLRNASGSNPESIPEVMFLDLKMPLLNGFEVLDWLRKQTFNAQMRVVILSGSDHENDKGQAIHLGAAEYLVKPVRTSDLDRLLQDVCPAKTEMGARF